MSTKSKKIYNESATPDKPVLELKLAYFNDTERYDLIINYLFDMELVMKRFPYIIYKPGYYLEPHKPDLEIEMKKETDKMYISIRGFDGNRRILMNPAFVKRINSLNLSGNYYDKAVIKRVLIENSFNNLKEELKAIIFYFLYPTSTLESKGISQETAKIIGRIKYQRTRLKRMKTAIRALIQEIITEQEEL